MIYIIDIFVPTLIAIMLLSVENNLISSKSLLIYRIANRLITVG